MASEVIKKAVRGNMHNDTRVVKVGDSKFGVMTSEVVKRPSWPPRPPKWLFEAICTWIPGKLRLLISNLWSYDLRGRLE